MILRPASVRISKLVRKARRFSHRLDRVKRRNASPDSGWFPYPVMDNLGAIEGLLSEHNQDLFSRIGNGPLADLGAADGDLTFFLEAQGFDVDLVDMASS